MVKIIFCRDGESCSDFEISNITDKIEVWSWEYGNYLYKTSTHLLIDSIRARMKKGTIRSENIEFEVEDLEGKFHKKTLDQHGRSMDWYDSEELQDRFLDVLL